MNDALLHAAAALAWVLMFAVVILTLAYRRASLGRCTLVWVVLVAAYWLLSVAPPWWKTVVSIPAALLLLLNVRGLRVALITRPFLRSYRRLLPSMSAPEREALDA